MVIHRPLLQSHKQPRQLANVSPSVAINSLMTPANDDGISAFTLSVVTSAMGHIYLHYRRLVTSQR